jgi:hypothetical protein
MQILTIFLKQLTSIFTSSKGYMQFSRLNRWQLLWFCAACSVLLSAIWSAKVIRHDLAQFKTNAQQAAQEFALYYPEDLQINWDGTKLTSEPTNYYTVYFPSFITGSELNLPQNLASFIPNQTTHADLNEKYKDSFAVITPTQLYTQTSQSEWDTFALADFIEANTFTFTKQEVEASTSKSILFDQTFWHQVQVIVLVLGPFAVFSGIIWNGTIQFLLAFLIIIKLYGTKIQGKILAKLSIPVVIVATFIQLTAELLYGRVTLPLFSIGYWLLLFLALKRFSKRKT